MEIRFVKDSDLREVLDIYQYYIKNTDITFDYEVPLLPAFKDSLQETMMSMPFLVAVEENQVVGYAYANKFKGKKAYDWAVETTIYIDHKCTHQGIGVKLYDALFSILKELGYCRCYACITYPNPGSIAFHQKFGFEEVGMFHRSGYKFGRWIDMIYMELSLQETDDPQPPKSIHEIDFESRWL